jgi:hypothetical protein
MSGICAAEPCPVILNSTCVFYRGANLIYTGVLTNDNLQTVIEKIDAKFKNAAIGYAFNNGITQAPSAGPVQLGGPLLQNTTITSSGFDLNITETINAGRFATIGGTSSQFVKGDGSLDSTSYQPSGTYIASLTGDGTAIGPGSAVFTLTDVNTQTGTYGSGSVVPTITVDSKGRITNVVNTNITYPTQSISFTGDVYGSGSTENITTLTLNTVNPDVYTTDTILKFAVNGKGLVTSAAPITGNDIENLLGYTPVPTTRTLTINGTTYDLSANRSWTISTGGTVSSVSVTPGTGISASVSNPTTTPNITITNTAPDKTVVLSDGVGISVTGTYPNFTITNTSPSSGGTVTAVTASSPLASSGGTTPNITIQQASGSQAGYLSSTDWTTFNSKQNTITLTTTGTSGAATFASNTLNIPQYQAAGTYITSVGATGPITSSGGTTPTISTSMATNKLIGRSNAGTGVMEEITVGTGLSLSGGTLNATGTSASVGFEMNFLLMGA